jgi:hypothetical protein
VEPIQECWSTEPSDRPAFVTIVGRLRALSGQVKQESKAASNNKKAAKMAM